MENLGIYARQSREKETSGSIEDQIQEGIKQAQQLGINHEIYVDKGESAAPETLENRPQFIQLLKDIEKGKITSIFVYDESRLTRNQTTKVHIKKILLDNDIKIYTKIEGIIDLKDSDNEFISDLRTLMAQKFVKDSSKKIKGVLRNRVSEGKAHGGILKPYGYKADADKLLIIDEEEAKVVQEIYHLSLQGLGTGRIAKLLNLKNVPTKGQKLLKNGIKVKNKYTQEIKHITNDKITWAGNTVLSILKNSIYKGERLHKGEIFSAPAIIDNNTWAKVQLKLQENRNNTGPAKFKYLLKGLCTCGRCGNNFVGRTRENRKDHYYYCSSKIQKKNNCGIRSINIDYLDEVIWYAVSNSNTITKLAIEQLDKLLNPDYIDVLKSEKKDLENQLVSEENSKGKIIELLKRNVLDISTAEIEILKSNKIIEKLKNELVSINIKLENQSSIKEQIDIVQGFQNQLENIKYEASFELKYELVRMYIDRIFIQYDDIEETYSIDLMVKFPEHKEMHTFYLKKGVAPNLLTYDIEKDKYYNKINSSEKELYNPPYFKWQHLKQYDEAT